MIRINGIFFDGRDAREYQATLISDGSVITIQNRDETKDFIPRCDLKSSCTITPRLGSTRRIIRFKEGQAFETQDASAIEDLEKLSGVNRTSTLISRFESQWKLVVCCLAGLCLTTYVGINFGIPTVAKHLAFQLPVSIISRLSHDAEEVLDKQFFKPSRLNNDQKEPIQKAFDALSREMASEHAFTLTFKQSRMRDPNAFALPSGRIIMTDELVKMSRNIKELEAIIIHEMAHIQHRHGIRSIIQNTGIVVVISLLVGDVTSITSLASAIPTLLVESGYSRKFETQADEAVAHYFKSKQWGITPYTDILTRVSSKQLGSYGSELLSTHPDLLKRLQHLRSIMRETE